MRAVLGLLLILLGLAMAVVWMPEHDGEQQLAVVTEIATQGLPPRPAVGSADHRGPGPVLAGRTFSPQMPLLTPVELPGAQTFHSGGVARVVRPAAEQPRSAAVIVGALVEASVVNSGAPHGPASATAQARTTQSVEMGRDELIRNLQRELRRVGCYYGEIDGDWGTGSRRAMGTFTDRVNASLPIDQPDLILLTLIKGYPGTACGKGCPSGQAMSDDGRCLPNAVVAQARRGNERRQQPAIPERERQVASDVEARRLPARPSAGTRPWVASVQMETSSGAPTGPSSVMPMAVAAVPQLPGRMGMGGPAAGEGPALVPPPQDPTFARDAVRGATGADGVTVFESARAPNGKRSRRARRGGPAVAGFAYRYYSPTGYRAPRVYASAPRRTSRSWTGSFFGNP